jgi:hypothetical protein
MAAVLTGALASGALQKKKKKKKRRKKNFIEQSPS